MTLSSLLALTAAMFVLALTPGPGVFVTISAGLTASRQQIMLLIAGIITGDIVFLMLSLFGLSWIAAHLHGAFLVLQYAGAAYLCFLGVRLILDRHKLMGEEQLNGDPLSRRPAKTTGFSVGLVVTLSNPKAIFFYISFLPNFIDLNSLTSMDIVIVSSIIALVLSISMGFYAWLAYSTRKASLSERAQSRLNVSSGSLMLVTGALLAIKAE